jgi:hypothetical protein
VRGYRDGSRRDGGGTEADPARATVGKTTLADTLAPDPEPAWEQIVPDDPGDGSRPNGSVPPALEHVVATDRGVPLPDAPRWSAVLGADVSAARVVTGASAERAASSIGARAFTLGDRMFFGAGQYAPGTPGGDRLITHELAHVVQQGAKPVASLHGIGMTSLDDAAEHDAREVANGGGRVTGGMEAVIARDAWNSIASPVHAVDLHDDDAKDMTASAYIKAHETQLVVSTANLLPPLAATLRAHAPAIYAPWADRGPEVVARAVAAVVVSGSDALRRLIAPTRLEDLVDGGRQIGMGAAIDREGSDSSGSSRFRADVAQVCAGAIMPRIADSIARVTPRYPAARAHAQQQAWDAMHECVPDVAPEPSPDLLLATHPMDRPVIQALCGGHALRVDLQKYGHDHGKTGPAAVATRIPVNLLPMVEAHPNGRGDAWNTVPIAFGTRPQPVWVRALAANPRIEDVALTLFGDPADAYRLTAAPPLFAFDVRSRHALLEPYRTLLPYDPVMQQMQAGFDRSGEWHGDQPPVTSFDISADRRDVGVEGDPLLGLDKGAHDEAALAAVPAREGEQRLRGAILVSMQRSGSLLETIATRVQPLEGYDRVGSLGYEEALASEKQRTAERRARLQQAPESEIARWDAHAAAQESVLVRVHDDVIALAGEAELALKSFEGVKLFNDLARSVRLPIQNVLSKYVGTAAASGMPSIAEGRLAQAKSERSVYKVEMMDLILQEVEATLRDVKPKGTLGPQAEADLRLETELRGDVARVRMLILSSDPAAGAELDKLWSKVQNVQTDATLLSNMDSLDHAWREMDSMADRFGVWGSFDTDLRELQKESIEHRGEWNAIYGSWVAVRYVMTPDGEAARKGVRDRVAALSKKVEATKFTQRMQRAMENAGGINAFAKVVGMLLIIIATAGTAIFLQGVLVGAEAVIGATGVLAIKVVTDAVVFTALHTAMFAENPTLKSVAIEFAYNLVLFGAMRYVSMALEASRLGVFLTELGSGYLSAAKLGAESLVLVTGTLARAEVESLLDKGRTLTREEAMKITLETVAMYLATVIVARVAQPLLAPLKGAGGKLGMAIQRANLQRAHVRELGKAIQTSKRIEGVPELQKADAESLKADIEALEHLQRVAAEDPSLLKKAGLSDEQIAELTKNLPGSLGKLKVAQLISGAEHVTGQQYNVPEAQVGEHLARHSALGATVTPRAGAKGDAQIYEVEYPDGTKVEIWAIPEAVKPADTTLVPDAAAGGPPPPPAAAPAKPRIVDDYSAFGDKHNLGDLDVARLRDAKVDLKRVEALIKGGRHNAAKSPAKAAELAAAEVELAAKLEATGIATGKRAKQLAEWAGDAEIIEKVDLLLAQVGKHYKNPEKLGAVLEWIGKGSKQHVQAIDDALLRMAKGHDVRIEAEADVVDDSDHEAIQHKQVSGGEHQYAANVKSALKQLAGKGAADEVPRPGYKRIAAIRLTETHPHHKSSPQELGQYLKDMKTAHDRLKASDPDADPNAELEGLAPDLEVHVTNANGTFKFRGPSFDPI